MLSPLNGTMMMMACDTEKLRRTVKCTPGDALISIGEKKNQEGFCFHFPRACYNYILIYLEGNIAASFVKLILFIKELDLNVENHHRYFGLICSK